MKFTAGKLTLGIILAIVALGLLRYRPWSTAKGLNKGSVIHEGGNRMANRELTVGYLPVTCHLTCPVTDFASKTTEITNPIATLHSEATISFNNLPATSSSPKLFMTE